MLPLAVWLGWVGIGVWSWSVLLRREFHPYTWPLLTLLAVMFVGLIALIVRGGLALIRRRGRRVALGALCCGSVPCWLLAAHLGYVQATTAQRLESISPLTLTILPVAIALADVETAWRYPERTEGERVVMFHDGVDNAERIVAAADEHLAHLESVLGRPARTRVYWVRGSVLGQESCSFGAFALTAPQPFELLSHVDRHELAHAAIDQHLTAFSRPPMLLMEGWAEACAGEEPDVVNFSAARESDCVPSISDLAGPTWASLDVGPVYTQGALFVDELLDGYGGEKFLNLYVSCSPSTFDADCRRALGVGLETLEERHKSRMADWTAGKRLRRLLSSLPVGDDVDQEGWHEFIDAYTAAIDNGGLPHDYEARVTTTFRKPATPEQPDPQVVRDEVRIVRSGDRRLLFSDNEVLAITREDAFQLRRADADHPWRVDKPSSPFPAVNRWSLRTSFASQWTDSLRTAFDWSRTWDWAQSPPTLVEFARSNDAEGPLVHITLERETGEQGKSPVSLRMSFSPAVEWRNVFTEERLPATDDGIVSTRLDYDYRDGALVGLERNSQRTTAGEIEWTSNTRIRIRDLPEDSASGFSPADYGLEIPPVNTGAVVTWPVRACLIFAALQMLMGGWMVSQSSRRPGEGRPCPPNAP